MATLVVIENIKKWNLDIPGLEVVAARDYLVEARFSTLKNAKVFNLCRTYGYQTVGYYVSLLATARGHKAMPSVSTIQDLRSAPLLRIVGEDLDEIIQRSLGDIKSETFELSIYFGRNVAKRYDKLSQALFSSFPSPFLRAELSFEKKWRLETVRPIATSEIPEGHREFAIAQTQKYFDRPWRVGVSQTYRHSLAILHNPEEYNAPSDDKALQKFMKAARSLGIDAELIGKEDYGRIAEFDALFIRETTAVNHHTYRFARRAEAEGLVVIDDPESILRCTNKVYLAEMFAHYELPCPRTLIVHPDTAQTLLDRISLPLVVKRPDSSFSRGVMKAETKDELARHLEETFDESELAVVQAFVPSQFDWRIGVLNGRALYACRYFMAPNHWQIQRNVSEHEADFGKHETLPLEATPPEAIRLAEKAAARIGTGLYGVDIKEVDGRFLIIEVNDNPSIEAGVEDAYLKDDLYLKIMRHFYERLEERGRRRGAP